MASYDDVARRWYDRALGSTKSALKNPRMIDGGDQIYSYGTHFEIGRAIRDKKGEVILFLLNGDRYSNTTTGHQSTVRSVVQRSTVVPNVIIPYSVLESAGISRDAVHLVQATRDQYVTTRHTTTLLDDVPKSRGEYIHNLGEMSESDRSYYQVDANGFPLGGWGFIATFDGVTYRWTTKRHWLGESLIEAELPYFMTCRSFVPSKHMIPAPNWPDYRDEDTPEVRDAKWAVYEAEGRAHRGSFIPSSCVKHGERCTGRIRKVRRAKFLSGFDHNETRRSYFFCELPKTDATTVEEAYAVLKPDTVKVAESMGREVKRQGDIFAIALPAVTKRHLVKAGATFTKGGGAFHTDHQATELATLPDGTTFARGTLRHKPPFRDPDHARMTLGKSFHVLVKNTVPLSA